MTEKEVIALIKDRILRAGIPVMHRFLIREEDGYYTLSEEGGCPNDFIIYGERAQAELSFVQSAAKVTGLLTIWHWGLIRGFDLSTDKMPKGSEFRRGWEVGQELHKWVKANVPNHNCRKD
mgnify:CR=1 FL=1